MNFWINFIHINNHSHDFTSIEIRVVAEMCAGYLSKYRKTAKSEDPWSKECRLHLVTVYFQIKTVRYLPGHVLPLGKLGALTFSLIALWFPQGQGQKLWCLYLYVLALITDKAAWIDYLLKKNFEGKLIFLQNSHGLGIYKSLSRGTCDGSTVRNWQ